MKKNWIGYVAIVFWIFLFLSWVKGYVFGEPTVEEFVIHVVVEGDTADSIIQKYNGGADYDEDIDLGLILLNPHVGESLDVGEQIMVPIFEH